MLRDELRVLVLRLPVKVHQGFQVVNLFTLFFFVVKSEQSYKGEDAADEGFALCSENDFL